MVSLPTDDFDGNPRPVDGTGDGNARRDMGAFEYQPKPGDPPTGPDPILTLTRATPAPTTRAAPTVPAAATTRRRRSRS